jgi:hypothetical protein
LIGARRRSAPHWTKDDESSGGILGKAMGKKARLKRERKKQAAGFEKKFSELMTKNFQKELRNSEIWDQMVAEFGKEKAEQLLKECKADVKPGDKI